MMLASSIDLDDYSFFAMEERCTGVESLFFLLETLKLIESRVNDILPSAFGSFSKNFYERSETVVNQLRSFTYRSCASHLLQIVSEILFVKHYYL